MTQVDIDRYLKAVHAMQSGVKMMINYEHPDIQTDDNATDPSTGPKHLRVGINVNMSDHAALIHLLLDKKIITIDDYDISLADQMEDQVKMYEKNIEEAMFNKTGNRIKMHLS